MIQPARSQPPLIIHGAGGHGRVVAEAARLGGWTVLGFVDDGPGPDAGHAGVRLLDPDDPKLATAAVHVAIGDNAVRRRVAQRLTEEGLELVNIIHPAATVSADVELGRGIYIGAQAVVGPDTTIGDNALINTSAVVEHDCVLGVGAHVAPTAALAGSVRIGEMTLVGVGAKIIPGVSVGDRCVVGAGAVVVKDAGDDQRIVGVPARATPL